MKRILISILSILFFTHVSEAQLLPATVKKPTPAPVQKPISKPIAKPSQKPVVAPKETIEEQKPVARKKTIALPAGPENFNFNDNYVLFDDFSSNANGWLLTTNSKETEEISNGIFTFQGKTEKSEFYADNYFGVDLSKDFSYSVKAKWKEGVVNYGYGIQYCSDHSNYSYHVFYISSNGYYRITYMEKGKAWKDLKAWTTSSYVNKGSIPNILEVKHVGRYMEYYINGNMVERLPFDQPFGNNFGFWVYEKQTVEFDDLLVQGKSLTDKINFLSDEDALLQIGTARAPLYKDVPYEASIPKGLYDVTVANAGDADEKVTFKLNLRGQRDVISKPVQFKSQRTLKAMAQQSKVVLVPVMDQITTLWGFKDSATGKFLVPYQYDWADSMFDGMAIVNRGKQFGFINEMGDEVVPCKYWRALRYENEYGRFISNGLYGYLDKRGNEMFTQQFSYASPFSNGYATVSRKRDNVTEYSRINKNGQSVIPYNFEFIGSESVEGFFQVIQNKKYGFMDKQNNTIVAPMYEGERNFSNGLAAVKLNNKWGFIDNKGIVVIPFLYDMSGPFNNGGAWVKLNGKWGIIDKSGKTIIPFTYDDANAFYEDLATVQLRGKWGAIDSKGSWLVAPKYDSIGVEMRNGMLPAKLNGSWGVINRMSEQVVPFTYEFVGSFVEGMARVKKGEKFGYIDSRGIEVVHPIYAKCLNYYKSLAFVNDQSSSKNILIDKTGKRLTD